MTNPLIHRKHSSDNKQLTIV